MTIETGVGDVIDRLTILELKAAMLPTTDPRRALVERERQSLAASLDGVAVAPEQRAELLSVNRQIWDTLAEQRRLDHSGNFGEEFVRVSRMVYQLNDHRAGVKARINERANSDIREVKVYPENMTQMDGDTAYMMGTIHYYHQLQRESESLGKRVRWVESELARLEREMPSVMGEPEGVELAKAA